MILTEQIGAMALIDELRANDIALEEHLNADQKKSALCNRIRDYYNKKGIAVTDDLINLGVQEYFKNRLRFIPTTLTPMERVFASLYISRERWLKKSVATLVTAIVLIFATVSAESWLEGNRIERRLVLEETYRRDLQALKIRFAQTNIEATNLSLWTPTFVGSAYKEWTTDVYDGLSSASETVHGLPDQLDAGELAYSKLRKEDEKIGVLEDLIKIKPRWESLDQQMVELETRSETEEWYPPVAKSWSELKAQANSPGTDVATLKQGLISLNKLLRTQATVASEQKDLEATYAAAIGSGIAGRDKIRVDEIFALAKSSLVALNVDDFKSRAHELEYLNDLAATELQYRVVNRPGTKSGVERTYNSSGGKKWYGVVEAVNQSGKPFAMRVTDSESSLVSTERLFAVEISQERYQRMKDDKLSDGIVDDAVLGTKPIGKLEFIRNTGVLPGLITRW